MNSFRDSVAFSRSPSPPSYPTTGSNVLMGRNPYQFFFSTRSRAIRVFNLPKDPVAHLTSLFRAPHTPVSLWCLREDFGGPPPGEEDSVWAVFRTHEQAAVALGLGGRAASIATALEIELEPYRKLRKIELVNPQPPSTPCSQPSALGPSSSNQNFSQPPHQLHNSQSVPDLYGLTSTQSPQGFTLSSNPPNPRHAFRPGDWICPSINCGAHNFMRNTICIACRSHRPISTNPPSWTRVPSSPRFVDAPFSEFIKFDASTPPRYSERAPVTVFNTFSSLGPSITNSPNNKLHLYTGSSASSTGPHYSSPPVEYPKPINDSPMSPTNIFAHNFPNAHPPINTKSEGLPALQMSQLPFVVSPSGRTMAVNVRPHNVSNDPLNPCVILWPENEPLPSQGQIRPITETGPQLPPIMNTGNKGPIALQPGDWLCNECKYVNWRRRKVCETCYPYADGNSDGVSASVQAERIAVAQRICNLSMSANQLQQRITSSTTSHTHTPSHLRSPPNFVDTTRHDPVVTTGLLEPIPTKPVTVKHHPQAMNPTQAVSFPTSTSSNANSGHPSSSFLPSFYEPNPRDNLSFTNLNLNLNLTTHTPSHTTPNTPSTSLGSKSKTPSPTKELSTLRRGSPTSTTSLCITAPGIQAINGSGAHSIWTLKSEEVTVSDMYMGSLLR